MEIVWERGSALVKDVHTELYRRKGLAYTTVMTEMTQMYRKGVLAHSKRGRAYVYTPKVTRREALDATLGEFASDFFHGSRQELARFALGERDAPEMEMEMRRAGTPPPGGNAAPPPRTVPAARHDRDPEEEDVTLL